MVQSHVGQRFMFHYLLREWKQYIWVRFFFMLTPRLRSRQWIFITGASSLRPDLRISSGSSWESVH